MYKNCHRWEKILTDLNALDTRAEYTRRIKHTRKVLAFLSGAKAGRSTKCSQARGK
jgi:hypothetical protein